jgi:hypothetical protein
MLAELLGAFGDGTRRVVRPAAGLLGEVSGAVGKPSGRAASITAWCSAVVGTVLIRASALLSDRVVVPTVVAGLGLVVVGVAAFVVRVPWE